MVCAWRVSVAGNAQEENCKRGVSLLQARRLLAAEVAAGGPGMSPITNVVFMGMGEPMHNLDAVLSAVEIMCNPWGLHMSHNKVGMVFEF